MAESDAGERSEQATPKRQKEARDKGQVARSKELTTALLLIIASVGLYAFSNNIGNQFAVMARKAWQLDRKHIFDPKQMLEAFGYLDGQVALALAPLFILLFLLGLLSPLLTGGFSFSSKALAPKASKLSLAKGFKRMFGMHALMELLKALAKVLVISLVAYLVILKVFPELLTLGSWDVELGIGRAMDLVALSFFLISLSLLVIALIDVPYQIWNHNKQLKMTKQEVKDEYKEMEGKPEVKSRIRQVQREMSQRRMMDAIPDADVVVTNPEHYSVAIKYDPMRSSAPIVVAKGVDVIAMQIRKVAIAHNIEILPAPPLARALYYSTKIDREIPQGLYLSVAQVLSYIFQLKKFRQGKAERPQTLKDLNIPDDLKH
jgi:flagellar biosynthetic protein FlhB